MTDDQDDVEEEDEVDDGEQSGGSHFVTTDHQEIFGNVFLYAIASLVGCQIMPPTPDHKKVDFMVGKHVLKAPGVVKTDPWVAFQVKTTIAVASESPLDFGYKADRGLYDWLRETVVGAPRYLVVVRLPRIPTHPFIQDPRRTMLRNAPFFGSYAGYGELKPGRKSKVLRLKKANVFTPAVLERMIDESSRRSL